MTQRKFTRESLLAPEEVAETTGLALPTLASWRSRKIGPDWLKIGRKIWYPVADFEKWMEGQIRHAGQNPKREVALQIPGSRKDVLRSDRLGRHRTQQDRCDEDRSRGEASGYRGAG